MGFMISCLIPMEGSWRGSDSRPRRSRSVSRHSVSSRTSDFGTLRGFGASDTRLCGRLRQACGTSTRIPFTDPALVPHGIHRNPLPDLHVLKIQLAVPPKVGGTAVKGQGHRDPLSGLCKGNDPGSAQYWPSKEGFAD